MQMTRFEKEKREIELESQLLKDINVHDQEESFQPSPLLDEVLVLISNSKE